MAPTLFGIATLGQGGYWLSGIALTLLAGGVVLLKLRRGWAWALIALVLVGVLQNVLVTATGLPLMRWVDDIVLVTLATLAVIESLRDRTLRGYLWIPGLVLLVDALQLVRSPTFEDGLLQLRQFAAPLLLISIAIFMRSKIDVRAFIRGAVWISIAVSIYMFVEAVIRGPLISPVYSYLLEAGGNSVGDLRGGLPSAYYSDITSGLVWFRPGGPFFNPPIAGIFIGTGVYAAVQLRSSWLKWFAIVLGFVVVAVSLGRAGLLLVVIVTIGFYAWQRFGKSVSIIAGGVLAIVAGAFFWTQGNTASHAIGLADGLMIGITHPFGDGFGHHGYFTASGASESLLGLLFAIYGVVAVLFILVVLACICGYLLRIRPPDSLPGLYLLGVLLVCAFSESAAALQGSIMLWLFVGFAMQVVGRDLVQIDWIHHALNPRAWNHPRPPDRS